MEHCATNGRLAGQNLSVASFLVTGYLIGRLSVWFLSRCAEVEYLHYLPTFRSIGHRAGAMCGRGPWNARREIPARLSQSASRSISPRPLNIDQFSQLRSAAIAAFAIPIVFNYKNTRNGPSLYNYLYYYYYIRIYRLRKHSRTCQALPSKTCNIQR